MSIGFVTRLTRTFQLKKNHPPFPETRPLKQCIPKSKTACLIDILLVYTSFACSLLQMSLQSSKSLQSLSKSLQSLFKVSLKSFQRSPKFYFQPYLFLLSMVLLITPPEDTRNLRDGRYVVIDASRVGTR